MWKPRATDVKGPAWTWITVESVPRGQFLVILPLISRTLRLSLVHLSTVISPTYIKLNLISAITKEDPGSVGRIPKGRAPAPVDYTTRRKQPRLTQLLFPWVFQSLPEIEIVFFSLLSLFLFSFNYDKFPVDDTYRSIPITGIRLISTFNLFSVPSSMFSKKKKEKEKEKIEREMLREGRMLSNVLNIRRSATFSYFFYKFRGRFTDSLSQLSFPGELPERFSWTFYPSYIVSLLDR